MAISFQLPGRSAAGLVSSPPASGKLNAIQLPAPSFQLPGSSGVLPQTQEAEILWQLVAGS